MISTLIILIIVLVIVLIAVSIIKVATKFLLQLGIFALIIFLAWELIKMIK